MQVQPQARLGAAVGAYWGRLTVRQRAAFGVAAGFLLTAGLLSAIGLYQQSRAAAEVDRQYRDFLERQRPADEAAAVARAEAQAQLEKKIAAQLASEQAEGEAEWGPTFRIRGGGEVSRAEQLACDLVRAQLRAPKTAEFTECRSRALRGNAYRVTGTVDAQNALGVPLRHRWAATMVGGGDDWTCTAFNFSD